MEKKVKLLENKLAVDPSVNEAYIKCKDRLKIMYDKVTDSIIMRSRVQWFEEGERNTKYFLNLEKKQKYKTYVWKILVNNHEITDTNEILMEIKNYFSNKYKRENNITEQECKMYLQNINIPKISVEEGASLGEPIRLSEIFSALNDMSNSKTPGNDGLPKEFFVAFFHLIGQDLLNSYNTSYATGCLSSSQTQAVITLIEKVGKDNRKLSGWRPISLINTDTKIIGKILVARVKHILPQIIDSDQYAFVPERFIDEATRLIADILEYTKMENIGGILFAADFAAAFDSLDYTFLFAALEAFGFPDTFVKWVKVLYINSESCVMNYGKSTGYFKLMRGAKQGDPLAPYLFLIAIEVLAAKVRNDENICGIMVNNCIIKQCLFADDATFFEEFVLPQTVDES